MHKWVSHALSSPPSSTARVDDAVPIGGGTSPMHPTVDDGCRHQFIVRALHKPVSCAHCGNTMWVWEGVHYRHCKMCKADVHERCFAEYVRPPVVLTNEEEEVANATPSILEEARKFVHQHELDKTRFYALAKWRCALCRAYITPGAEGLHCVSCDDGFCLHELCYEAHLAALESAPRGAVAHLEEEEIKKEPLSTSCGSKSSSTSVSTIYARRLTEEEVAARSADDHKASAIADTLAIMQALCFRNVRWKTLLSRQNPLVVLPAVVAEHVALYNACCEKLCGGGPHPVVEAESVDGMPNNASPEREKIQAGLSSAMDGGNTVHASAPPSDGATSTVPQEEIESLQDALRFATAVYGLAYQKNSMSSCASSVAMRIFHPDRLAPKDEVNNTAITEILALPRSALLHSHWSYRTLEPSFCVLADHDRKTIVLAFRGSLSTADFISDACGLTRDFGTSGGGIAGAHHGMAHMVDLIFEESDASREAEMPGRDEAPASPSTVPPEGRRRHPSTLMKILDRLLLQEYTDFGFLVTGHSLGGGLAQLFAVRAVTERHPWVHWHSSLNAASSDDADGAPEGSTAIRRRMRVVAFAPPPVLTMPSADWFDGWITCVVGGSDVVCRLQLNAIDRLANHLGGGGGTSSKKSTAEDGSSLPSVMSELTEEMHLVGRIVFLTHPTDRERNRAVAVSRTTFVLHHIFVVPQMVSNHLMDCYAKGLAASFSTDV